MEGNELLSKVLAENIEKVSGGVGAAVDLTLEQAPEVIEQALLWSATSSFLSCLAGVIGFVLIFALTKKYIRAFRENNDDFYEHPELMFLIFPIIFSLVMLDITWLKIWIAPKVWLIEYAASLVK